MHETQAGPSELQAQLGCSPAPDQHMGRDVKLYGTDVKSDLEDSSIQVT
jgi:hypothetical protein